MGQSIVITTEGIRATLARLQDGYTRLDAAALAANYAEECVVESPVAGVHHGRMAVEHAFRMIFSAFPDMNMRTDECLTFGNRAVWSFKVTGTDNGGLMGLPPTRAPFSTTAIFLYTFGYDHQIVHERRVYDFSRLLMQLAGEASPATEGPRVYRELLERARQEHELEIAADIQRALLPQSRHVGNGFEVAASSVPCRAIGGDFFDYFNLPDGGFAFVLGDVAGKGPPAALLAAVLQGLFSAQTFADAPPAETLKRVNEALMRRAIDSRFATVVYAMLSRDGRLSSCNAGHNPPLLVRRFGERRLERGGLIVGAFREATFEEDTLQLEPGDTLVLFSDGVTEALNTCGEEFGDERLLACVNTNRELPPQALVTSLLDTVQQFSAGAEQSDDRTALVLRYTGA